jgi:F-type H+-transporting ATPase subunit b
MRVGRFIACAAILALLICAPARFSFVRADDADAAHKDKAGEHGKEAKEAAHGGSKDPFKPPYNPLDLTLWSAVIFVLMVAVLWKFAWKPILSGLQTRENTIRDAMETAERSRKEALELHDKLDAQLKAGGDKVREMMDDARKDASALKDQMVADAKTEIQQERDRLHREMDTAKDQALKEIYEQSVSLAALLSAKAIRRTLSPEDHRRLLDDTLAELKQAGPAHN